jgi:hypothetical protein
VLRLGAEHGKGVGRQECGQADETIGESGQGSGRRQFKDAAAVISVIRSASLR